MSMEIRLETDDREVSFFEQYHGGPYVTEFIASEAFDPSYHDKETGIVVIPVEAMENRLRPALDLLRNRQKSLYGRVMRGDVRALKALVAEYRLATDGKKTPVLKVFY